MLGFIEDFSLKEKTKSSKTFIQTCKFVSKKKRDKRKWEKERREM